MDKKLQPKTDEPRAQKLINSYSIGATFAVLFITVSTIVGELYKPYKNLLADTFSHHWIGKGIVAVIVFITIGFIHSILSRQKGLVAIDIKLKNSINILFWITNLSILALLLFFIGHYLNFF